MSFLRYKYHIKFESELVPEIIATKDLVLGYKCQLGYKNENDELCDY